MPAAKSYRFGSDSGIGQLAAAVNRGDRHATRTVFDGSFTDIEKKSLQSGEEYQAMLEEALQGYQHFLSCVQQRSQPGRSSPHLANTSFCAHCGKGRLASRA